MKDEIKMQILQNAPVLIALHDPEHNLLWANRAYQKATGLDIEQLIGKKCWIAWGLERPCLNCPVDVAYRSGTTAEGEMIPAEQPVWPGSQGSWLVSATPLKDEEGSIIGTIEVVFEISHYKALDQNKFIAIAENLFDALVMIDEHGKVIYWNASAERIFGFSVQEIMGKDVHKILMPEEYLQDFERGFERFKKTGLGPVVEKTLELTAKTKSGEKIPIEISVSPIKKGEGYLAVATIRDISERKEREEKLQNQAQMLSWLYDAAGRLTEALDVRGIARETVRLCVDIFGVNLAWIGYPEEDGSVSVLAHYPEEISYPTEISVSPIKKG